MLVYVPHPNDPLYGDWMEVTSAPKVNPAAVRAILKERVRAKAAGGEMDIQRARARAVSETARMLGLTERTVRAMCHLARQSRSVASARG